jgi:hypothetical protein
MEGMRGTLTKRIMTVARWVGLSLVIASCSVSPRPEPPPVEQPPTLDTDGVSLFVCGPSCDMAGVAIHGAPGTVSHTNARGWAVNLDQQSPPVSFEVEDDGGFKVGIEGTVGSEFRLQLQLGDLRSKPLDFVLSSESETQIIPSDRALSDCLTVDPPDSLGIPTPGPTLSTLTVTNHCGEPVHVERVAMRVSDAAYAVRSAAGPFDLADGAASTVEVELTDATGDDEILFVEVSGPTYDRRPITLHSLDTP